MEKKNRREEEKKKRFDNWHFYCQRHFYRFLHDLRFSEIHKQMKKRKEDQKTGYLMQQLHLFQVPFQHKRLLHLPFSPGELLTQ